METTGDLRDGSREQGSGAGRAPAASRRGRPPQMASTGLARPARGLVRLLYSSNPFYILSADLVFVGLRISFKTGGSVSQSWALWLGLAGYTLLLATTACCLIRVGKLWDDLRSLLILVVLMFMAMALCTDEAVAANPRQGVLACAGGFLFAVAVTEAVLRTIRLRLPGWYRAGYYLILALVFLYPIALVPVLNEPQSPRLQWALFGFSALAALALLPLLPAARGGPAMLSKNGSPWRWPLYPWSLFVVMAAGLGVRCYSLCVSFHYVGGSRTIFGPYFLVPIGLAASLVWLEIAIASRRRAVMTAAAGLPLWLTGLALVGHRSDPVYMGFLNLFIGTLGCSPAFLALIAATLVAAYAMSRGVPLGRELTAAGLAGLAIVGPATLTLSTTTSPHWLPLVASGLLLASAAARHQCSIRTALAASLLVAGITRGLAHLWPSADLTPLAFHLSIASMLVITALFDDGLADLTRFAGAWLLLVLGVASALRAPMTQPVIPDGLVPWYPALAALICGAFGYLTRDKVYLVTATINMAVWLVYSGWETYPKLRQEVPGLDQIVSGLAFFLIAAAISLRKAGLGCGSRFRWLSDFVVRVWNRAGWEEDRLGRLWRRCS